MTLAQPAFLALLLLVAAAAVVVLWSGRWRQRARQRFAGAQAGRWPASNQSAGAVLLLAAMTLAALAAAGPQWGQREVQRQRFGLDYVIILDVSHSMEAADANPSRLALAQKELVRLVESRPDDRAGLVLFAGTAVMRSPLTADSQAMIELVKRADREAGRARAGSDIGAALRQAGAILAASEDRGKAVVLVSDGEDHAGSFIQEARNLREQGVVVYTAGIGTPQGAPLFQTSSAGRVTPRLDAQGRQVISRLVETSLITTAEAGGGRYLRLSKENDLLSLRNDLDGLEEAPLGQRIQTAPIQRYQWFLAASMLLLSLRWLLPRSLTLRLPSRMAAQPAVAVLLLSLLIGACGGGDSLRSDNAKANRLFDQGEHQAALNAYQSLLTQRPDLPELSYNTGNAFHRLGNYERAITETRRALPATTNNLGSATYYALGNHYLASGEFEAAYDSYKSALLLNPKDADSKYNLEVTLLQMAAREQERPPPPPATEPGGQPPADGGGPPQTPPETTPSQPPATPAAPSQPGGSAAEQRERQRLLQEALRGIDEELSLEEALEILDLLRQAQEVQPSSSGQNQSGPDY